MLGVLGGGSYFSYRKYKNSHGIKNDIEFLGKINGF